MNYSAYTARDFAKDTFFQKWVLDPDDETVAFWQNWLSLYPGKRATVAEAKEIITALEFRADLESNRAFLEVWDSISAAREEEKAKQSVVAGVSLWFRQHQQLAAVFIGLAVVCCGLFFMLRAQETPTVSYATQYGQTNTIVLPDSSVITLNANSSVSYAAGWDEEHPREVWLKGEAFFKVLKKGNGGNAKFSVHTNGLTVEVLGTQFNVNSRRKNTKVVLNSGKVRLKLHKGLDGQRVMMQPGDYVEYAEAEARIRKKRVDAAFYSSWVDNKLLFDKTSLKDIAVMVKDNYGLQLTFRDAELAEKRFTGMVPADDVELLFETLTKLYSLEMVRENGQVVLSRAAPVMP